jgi:hypothetical protein
MAPILSHGPITNGQCGFNQAASRPADPIKRHQARRERHHPKAMLTTQTYAVALDLLENSIGRFRRFDCRSANDCSWRSPAVRVCGEFKPIVHTDWPMICHIEFRFGKRIARFKFSARNTIKSG